MLPRAPAAPYRAIHGVLAIDKPAGITARQAAARIRNILSNGLGVVESSGNLNSGGGAAVGIRGEHAHRRRGWNVGSLKIGHGGTLDPFATGVCVLGVGLGTRRLGDYQGNQIPRDFVLPENEDEWSAWRSQVCNDDSKASLRGKDEGVLRRLSRLAQKAYTVRLELGKRTDTLDVAGKVIATAPFAHVVREEVERLVLPGAQLGPGRQLQRPPAVSAMRLDGKRLHKLVRLGKLREDFGLGDAVANMEDDALVSEGGENDSSDILHGVRNLSDVIPERLVRVLDVKVLLYLHIVCGHGYYIRRFADDLGSALGTYAYAHSLRRTQQGDFDISDAVPEARWTYEALMSARRAVRGLVRPQQQQQQFHHPQHHQHRHQHQHKQHDDMQEFQQEHRARAAPADDSWSRFDDY